MKQEKGFFTNELSPEQQFEELISLYSRRKNEYLYEITKIRIPSNKEESWWKKYAKVIQNNMNTHPENWD